MKKHTTRQKVKLAKKICELFEKDEHDLRTICANVIGEVEEGSAYNLFYHWAIRNPIFEISKMYRKAKQIRWNNRKKKLIRRAETGLEKLLDEKIVEEKQSTMKVDDEGNASIAEIKTTTKIIMPNPTAIIFTLKTLAPKKYTEVQKIEHSGQIKSLTDLIIDSKKIEESNEK